MLWLANDINERSLAFRLPDARISFCQLCARPLVFQDCNGLATAYVFDQLKRQSSVYEISDFSPLRARVWLRGLDLG